MRGHHSLQSPTTHGRILPIPDCPPLSPALQPRGSCLLSDSNLEQTRRCLADRHDPRVPQGPSQLQTAEGLYTLQCAFPLMILGGPNGSSTYPRVPHLCSLLALSLKSTTTTPPVQFLFLPTALWAAKGLASLACIVIAPRDQGPSNSQAVYFSWCHLHPQTPGVTQPGHQGTACPWQESVIGRWAHSPVRAKTARHSSRTSGQWLERETPLSSLSSSFLLLEWLRRDDSLSGHGRGSAAQGESQYEGGRMRGGEAARHPQLGSSLAGSPPHCCHESP